eukprot:1156435-Pelagomonas_calceolata.AAC.2
MGKQGKGYIAVSACGGSLAEAKRACNQPVPTRSVALDGYLNRMWYKLSCRKHLRCSLWGEACLYSFTAIFCSSYPDNSAIAWTWVATDERAVACSARKSGDQLLYMERKDMIRLYMVNARHVGSHAIGRVVKVGNLQPESLADRLGVW